ncbi:hypothetical protein LWE61_10205 [Sphingobium sufflavum]|uniref:hypothetical protein n=1 Tax=Sphingobium sufflavum TaxID=1129547 RepID=UPI001F1AC7D3|nr:hypothetical protein [Sphingobium sufflavum]MCE7796929.1 hypothetical protein [Sphingobium sufflavum]
MRMIAVFFGQRPCCQSISSQIFSILLAEAFEIFNADLGFLIWKINAGLGHIRRRAAQVQHGSAHDVLVVAPGLTERGKTSGRCGSTNDRFRRSLSFPVALGTAAKSHDAAFGFGLHATNIRSFLHNGANAR